ncbi:uncharacterized protein LOC144345906 [Saccoglossus kowalevskii]
MSNARQQRLSVAGPGYGPGRKESRKHSVLNFRAPKFSPRKKGEWNTDGGRPNCSLNRPAIVFVICCGCIAIVAGIIVLVFSVASSQRSVLRIVGPCISGLGIKMCAIGIIAKVKNDKIRKQLKEAENKKESEKVYVDPDLGHISLTDIENESAPSSDKLYSSNSKRTKLKGRTKHKQTTSIMQDFDSDTIPGLVALPEVESLPQGSFDVPLIAYPNTPRDAEEIRQSSATYHMPMNTHLSHR